MANPYKGVNDYQFWRRAVAEIEAHSFDPVSPSQFAIASETRVATAGSCFAQHIARRLVDAGCSHFLCEAGLDLTDDERVARNYGVFSARYGNIYTTPQLDQLFDEAFGHFVPQESAWARPDGRIVDVRRQQVEPEGFADFDSLLADRSEHLLAVRRMFSEAEVFIFTLGLTEAWRSKLDQLVFSSAPGVVAGTFDPDRHEFVNFGLEESYGHLRAFITKLRAVNPQVNILLTVSPVPLAATYEDRSVVVSTTYSKSVLRVAAEMATKEFERVDYFPSYEIITGSQARGRYFAEDAREVNQLGVAHAMRCFVARYVEGFSAGDSEAPARALYQAGPAPQIICDEDAIDAISF